MRAPEHTNQLAAETSPYLLQHAHNPVDWRPWGPAAFAAARERDVPIFLSIGYSTCYWCHVMERESFEHAPTAELMNERFVCIKVDREERPDVDEIYMAATVTMTGHGGWPMSCFLEPRTLKPYWCGTYFPRDPRPGMPTFRQVLAGMSDAWRAQRDDVLAQADQVAGAVRDQLGRAREPVPIGRGHVEQAAQLLLASFDRNHGGFGGAPKFPQPVFLEFLLETRAGADDDTRAAIDAAVRTTLDQMLIGGVHDQVGAGFHRYAVDATWTVPHFEKMLYDNAQLLALYARASVVYDDGQYRRVARRTADYVLREMTSADGSFFSAQDAEVDGREGLNYLWAPEEMRASLDASDADFAIGVYNLDRPPNFRDPHHPDDQPKHVLRLDRRPDELAERLGMDADAFVRRLDEVNAKLLEARNVRKQPHLDDKALAGWNGLMIAALAQAADALAEPRYAAAADSAATFIFERMHEGDTLLRSARGGATKTPAFLEDSAFLIAGLLSLHRSTHAPGDRLARALELVDRATEAFGDGIGGFFDTRPDQADLFVRTRSTHDGAIPAGVGVMLGNLIDLADATGDDAWLAHAAACLRSVSGAIADNPVGSVNSTRHLLRMMRLGDRGAGLIEFTRDRAPALTGSARVVEVLADTERVVVRAGEPAELHLALRIQPGHHIVAADACEADASLIPLRVGLVRGQGVAVYADYPSGDPYGVAGVGTINVHTGSIEFRVALEHAPGIGASPGEPVLGVTFQACTDDACLQPTTVALGVEIVIE
ncbi:MAG: thioredoxin domain-containing protein [Phycisphaerales bacterium]